MAYYRRTYAPRVNVGFSKPYNGAKAKPTFMYKAEDVWAAAAAATRINGGYMKEATYRAVTDENGYTSMVQDKEANKVMVRNMLATNTVYTDEDIARGAAAREYWQKSLLKMLGGAANDFEQTAIALANKEQIETVYDVSVISSLIASAERALARDAVNDVKLQSNSVHVGKVGETVRVGDAEVLTVRYNANFGKYRVDVRSNGNLFSWWASKSYDVGARVNVKGKIKSHYADRDTNVAITQLNYVKEV